MRGSPRRRWSSGGCWRRRNSPGTTSDAKRLSRGSGSGRTNTRRESSHQLRQLGASCDWRRVRFTLDEVCSRAVRKTFFKMFRDKLIYRGKRLVNWDTFLQTAVADDEVFTETVKGHFWTFTYPVVGSDETIAFSTTRPETMLGDTAVAIHPDDERYKHLHGKRVRIPVNGREIRSSPTGSWSTATWVPASSK